MIDFIRIPELTDIEWEFIKIATLGLGFILSMIWADYSENKRKKRNKNGR